MRRKERGRYDRETINAILDEALYCHVGFSVDGQPFVQPTIHARIGEQLYLHGAIANRMLKTLAGGVNVCVSVTLLDGLVLARSAFHHSMNYRSVMILGVAREVTALEEKRRAMTALIAITSESTSQRRRSTKWTPSVSQTPPPSARSR